ncbi:MAG: hypothetical protein HN356_02995 [Calditrichaeota bacterium]|nr:hypothetical protein [Calditrichota bacterium]
MSPLKSTKAVLSTLLKQQKINPTLFARIADIYMQMGKSKSAEKILREGVSDFPDHITGWIVKGNYHLTQNEREDAQDAFLKALELNFDIPYLHDRCRAIANEIGEHRRCFEHTAELIRLDSMNGALQNSYQMDLLRYIALEKKVVSEEDLQEMTMSDIRQLLSDKDLLPDEMQRLGRMEVAALFDSAIPEIDKKESLSETEFDDFRIDTTDYPEEVSSEAESTEIEEDDLSFSISINPDEHVTEEQKPEPYPNERTGDFDKLEISESADENQNEHLGNAIDLEENDFMTEETDEVESISEGEIQDTSDDSDIGERMKMFTSEDARDDSYSSNSEVEFEIPKPPVEKREESLENELDLEDDDFFTREIEPVKSIKKGDIPSTSDDLDISEQFKNIYGSKEKPDGNRSAISEVEFDIPEPPVEKQAVNLEETQKLHDGDVPNTPDEDIRERLSKIATEVTGVSENLPPPKPAVGKKRIPTETLGELYVAQKKWDDAIGVYTALLNDYPTSEKYRNRLQAIYKRMLSEERK